MKKKISALGLALVMSFALAACGNTQEVSREDQETSAPAGSGTEGEAKADRKSVV